MEKIGIDAGGTLIKIAYEEHGKLHVKTYSIQEKNELLQWLKFISPGAVLHVTGGKNNLIPNLPSQKAHFIDEFQSLLEGTRYLMNIEKQPSKKDYLVVNIGTGTSIFHVAHHKIERLSGSGVSGGTLMGLGSIITGKSTFQELIALAEKGNHENSDLLVRDIYEPNEPPIFWDLTAANFGKVNHHKTSEKADHMAALIQLVGEITISLAGQLALHKNIHKIVFIGSALNGNRPLKNVLSSFQDKLSYKAIFLDKGAYAGAIGALLA
ncbi:type II pantothenate kinase [Oceanobacillus sp. FSL K6-2867]|uniref:type II pantothenate kinase n=1 Tax=Oceanobacillus sp. FSL K6-2867 TaxID=2954748 RepID=UPI0030DCFB6E